MTHKPQWRRDQSEEREWYEAPPWLMEMPPAYMARPYGMWLPSMDHYHLQHQHQQSLHRYASHDTRYERSPSSARSRCKQTKVTQWLLLPLASVSR